MSRRTKFLLALAPQLLFLLYMVARAEWTLEVGTVVEIEVTPRDPMDPLSGRHLVLHTPIERLDEATVATLDQDLEVGQIIYVVVRADPPPAVPVALRFGPATNGEIALRARVTAVDGAVTVDYGFERYFIPLDATDPTLYRLPDGTRPTLRLLVSVADDGSLVSKDLIVDGRPFAEWNRSVPKH